MNVRLQVPRFGEQPRSFQDNVFPDQQLRWILVCLLPHGDFYAVATLSRINGSEKRLLVAAGIDYKNIRSAADGHVNLAFSLKANDGVFLAVHFFDCFANTLPLRIGDQFVGVSVFDRTGALRT